MLDELSYELRDASKETPKFEPVCLFIDEHCYKCSDQGRWTKQTLLGVNYTFAKRPFMGFRLIPNFYLRRTAKNQWHFSMYLFGHVYNIDKTNEEMFLPVDESELDKINAYRTPIY